MTGWLQTNPFQDEFDGLMVVLATFSLNIFNPGVLLYGPATAVRRKADLVDTEEKQ